MAKVIAFSGGCNSGKTTTINKVAEALEARGYKVVKLNELMREVTDKPIDELRKNPHEYLEIQERIISTKIDQEREAFNDESETIYLLDRAITDSMFYLYNYLDKSDLDTYEIIRLCNLNFIARQHTIDAFYKGYDMLLQFEPLYKNDYSDIYRPNMLKYLKSYEYQGINMINRAYLTYRNDIYTFFFNINAKNNSFSYIIGTIIDNLGL